MNPECLSVKPEVDQRSTKSDDAAEACARAANVSGSCLEQIM